MRKPELSHTGVKMYGKLDRKSSSKWYMVKPYYSVLRAII
jgi:hypothetical protein